MSIIYKLTSMWLVLALLGGTAAAQVQQPSKKDLMRQAEAGDAEAQIALGAYYRRQENNPTEALIWYEQAAQQGLTRAYGPACSLYFEVEPDWEKARLRCRQAAQAGSTEGYLRLATAYQTGLPNLPQDEEKAAEIHRELIEIHSELFDRGQMQSGSILADIYFENKLIAPDYDKAFYYTQATLGLRPRINYARLAGFYANGQGTETNLREAYRLYAYAAHLGDTEAAQWVAAHSEDMPERKKMNYLDVLPGDVIMDTQFGSASIANFYPPRAMDSAMPGKVTLECMITNEGQIENCIVIEDNPTGYGFDQATLRVITLFNLRSTNPDSLKPQAGKLIKYRFGWQLS
ncbi:MAG: energy transducer TonB [Asticcacaulis sp.]